MIYFPVCFKLYHTLTTFAYNRHEVPGLRRSRDGVLERLGLEKIWECLHLVSGLNVSFYKLIFDDRKRYLAAISKVFDQSAQKHCNDQNQFSTKQLHYATTELACVAIKYFSLPFLVATAILRRQLNGNTGRLCLQGTIVYCRRIFNGPYSNDPATNITTV